MDQEFGAHRMQVRDKGAAREGEQAAETTAASQAELRGGEGKGLRQRGRAIGTRMRKPTFPTPPLQNSE